MLHINKHNKRTVYLRLLVLRQPPHIHRREQRMIPLPIRLLQHQLHMLLVYINPFKKFAISEEIIINLYFIRGKANVFHFHFTAPAVGVTYDSTKTYYQQAAPTVPAVAAATGQCAVTVASTPDFQSWQQANYNARQTSTNFNFFFSY